MYSRLLRAALPLIILLLQWRLAHVPVGSFRHKALANAIEELDAFRRLEGMQ